MSKRKRTPRANGTPPRPVVEQSVQRAQPEQQRVAIPMLTAGHRWPPNADVKLMAGPDPKMPALLIYIVEKGAYQPVFLPPGSEWRVSPGGPRLW